MTLIAAARKQLAETGEWSYDLRGAGTVERFKAGMAFTALVLEVQRLYGQRPTDARTMAGLEAPVHVHVETSDDRLLIRIDGQPEVPTPAAAELPLAGSG